MSKDQEKTAVRIANIPEAEFEAAVESDNPPTITNLLRSGAWYHMSKDQEKTAVRIANIPEAEFEAAVESDNPPTITNLSRPSRPGFKEATHVLGELRRFAEFCREHQPENVATGVWEEEVPGLRENVVTVQSWLEQFITHLGE